MYLKTVENQHPAAKATVTVKVCGNIIEVRHSSHGPPEITIEKLNAEEYIDLTTGEIKPFRHRETRASDKFGVAKSLRNLRDIINTNLTGGETALWVTLTYRENMRNTQRLYSDFHAFIKRFRRYLAKHNHPKCEYIVAAEPQGRGAWHLHVLFLFPQKAPFLPNAHIAALWGHGFTKTKRLNGTDNPGLYLTAYLGNMEFSEAVSGGALQGQLKEVESVTESGDKIRKAIVKGARLSLYPSGFHFFRCSRGVKRPHVCTMSEEKAMEFVGSAPLTYEKTIEITDFEGKTVNVINYRQYNRIAEHDQNCLTNPERSTVK